MDAISTRRAQAPDFAAAPLNKVLIVMSGMNGEYETEADYHGCMY
jgi:hypothetical protein